MFTQMQLISGVSLTPDGAMRQAAEAHTALFTYAEHIGSPGCRVPLAELEWCTTRYPVVLRCWDPAPLPVCTRRYTTVMNWAATDPIEFDGESWGQKDRSMEMVEDLPAQVPDLHFSLAIGRSTGPPIPRERLREFGWDVVDSSDAVDTWEAYGNFVRASAGEFSVAKETYVKARTGWFSGRSACYLASGRPVVAQDTAWTDHLPSGAGLFGFTGRDEAIAALRAIERDPNRHSTAARAVAEEFFDSRTVLTAMMSEAA
jgi:hypothetical protein